MAGPADTPVGRAERLPLRVIRPARRAQPKPPRGPLLPNAVLGMVIFLSAEAMFFAGLISAFLILRANEEMWPPPGQPRLPVAVTGVNTLVLLFSGYTVTRAVRSVRAGERTQLERWLKATAALGALFLIVQGTEWVRLLNFGLHASQSTYGGTFYTLIGSHALHVLGGLVVLAAVLRNAMAGRYSARHYGAVEAARLYWLFVVGVWPILYLLVYVL